jgi:hypothetical protein
MFGGRLEEPFVVEKLRVSDDGRLYHPVTTLPLLATETGIQPCYGLVGSNVGIKLGLEYFAPDMDKNGNYAIDWEGSRHAVPVAASGELLPHPLS